MNNQKGISSFFGIIVVILVAIIGAVGFLSYQYVWLPRQATPNVPPTVSPKTVVSEQLFITTGNFDLINKTFEGRTVQPGGKNVKILITDSTKFYRTAEPNWEKDYFTFSELYSLFNNGLNWPVTVKGVLEEKNVIRASEIYYIVQ